MGCGGRGLPSAPAGRLGTSDPDPAVLRHRRPLQIIVMVSRSGLERCMWMPSGGALTWKGLHPLGLGGEVLTAVEFGCAGTNGHQSIAERKIGAENAFGTQRAAIGSRVQHPGGARRRSLVLGAGSFVTFRGEGESGRGPPTHPRPGGPRGQGGGVSGDARIEHKL